MRRFFLFSFFFLSCLYLVRLSELEVTVNRLQQEKASLTQQNHHLQQQNTDLTQQSTHLLQQQQGAGAEVDNEVSFLHQEQEEPSSQQNQTNEIPEDSWTSSSFLNAIATALLTGPHPPHDDLGHEATQNHADRASSSSDHLAPSASVLIAPTAGITGRPGQEVPGGEHSLAGIGGVASNFSSSSSYLSSSVPGEEGPDHPDFHFTFEEANAIVKGLKVFK